MGPAPEPPEDFLDPITCSLMTQPVVLPDSGVTLDRTTIERHLMSQVGGGASGSKLVIAVHHGRRTSKWMCPASKPRDL